VPLNVINLGFRQNKGKVTVIKVQNHSNLLKKLAGLVGVVGVGASSTQLKRSRGTSILRPVF